MVKIEGVNDKMIANNLTPCIPVHPGGILKEEIECRNISQRHLAAMLGVSYSVLNEILNEKRPVSTEYAMLFEAALGVDSKLLLRMQTDYDLQVAGTDTDFMNRLGKIREVMLAG